MLIFETQSLFVRHFELADAAFIFNLLNSPAWLQFIGNRNIDSIATAENYIQKRLIANYQQGFGMYAVEIKAEQIPIGMCGFIKREELPQPDIGFAFLPQYEGKGYAFEAAHATLVYGKTKLDLQTVFAVINNDNEKSIKLTEKLGLQFQKMIRLQGDGEELKLFSNEK
jgi:RimJ/RimL family protein N-acetyltransferase